MVDIPEILLVPIEKIRPNKWNPNEMDPEMFNELVANFEEDGFIQPIAVGPIEDDPDGYEFEIIDGEHRFDGLSVLEVPEIPCYVRNISSDKRKFLTVKMNRIRGKMDRNRFTALVKDLMERHSFEDVAAGMAFTDPTELEGLIANARDTLPSNEMKDEFDKAKKDIKTVDDLSSVLNRLFSKFGDTLPANFMVVEFGGKENLWVRLKNRAEYKEMLSIARDVMGEGFTFDSYLTKLLSTVPVSKFCAKYEAELVAIDETDDSELLED